ncbi:4-hydroxy-tetrahydrodipicolinate reductase [Vagococcus penaei]|uniref:4-hydroxy-tetrahydrodipicolinate reductase n=1 Tax=Vagococcus penaei TaxID=633807 RepID=A0A1Q2D8L8_9ENTE|nr:4-hydroxy-tetrahydrodipicolinate reductase [Vagococcus penaei]AQP54716.1 4-hydroxy-tetrahydrodipicolinate reductase [Vagococcus penaei]RSU05370.1 4-hydroxy-tetrahydrodipicolinate reductase [Vagococcus penaei]
MIQVIVAGFRGKMGQACTQMILDHPDFQLVGVMDPKVDVKELADVSGYQACQMTVPVFNSQIQAFASVPHADIWIDFTVPEVAYQHVETALRNGVRPVVGTTGFSDEEITNLIELSQIQKVGGIIAPNFAIGAILMMEFAQKAAQYFPDVEIIELHHDNKIDAPSGTALKTAEMISDVRGINIQGHPHEVELIPGARGADYQGLKIHSVRLPGLIAHQQVQFGGKGEGLLIRHDSYNRESFMTGVALACMKVMGTDELVYGLERWI